MHFANVITRLQHLTSINHHLIICGQHRSTTEISTGKDETEQETHGCYCDSFLSKKLYKRLDFHRVKTFFKLCPHKSKGPTGQAAVVTNMLTIAQNAVINNPVQVWNSALFLFNVVLFHSAYHTVRLLNLIPAVCISNVPFW